MTEYAYKVTLVAPCGGKRFAPFHSDEFLGFWGAEREAINSLHSQNCTRCGKAHMNDEYAATDVERGEADVNGAGTSYRTVWPGRTSDGTVQREFSFHG